MEKSFKSIVDQSKSILILLPKNPYLDQVAAGLALYLGLSKSKTTTIACPSPMVVEFNRLIGVDKVTSELGNKNLVVKFSDYDPENIERVAYDIENNEFRLSVIPKPQVAPPNRDQINVIYSGMSADTVILIGGLNDSHFPALAAPEILQSRLVHIGFTDFSSETIKNVISLSKPSSSESEIVADYLKEIGDITSDMASNLLAGIYEGTRNFTHSQVNANTFKLVSELMQAGGQYDSRVGKGPRIAKNQLPPVEKIRRDIEKIRAEVAKKEEVVEEKHPEPVVQPEPQKVESNDTNEEDLNPPQEWLKQPKVYKGASEN